MFAFLRRLAFSLALLMALSGLGACAILPLEDGQDYQDSRDQASAGRPGKHRPEGRHRGRPEPAAVKEESRSTPEPAVVLEDSRADRPEGKRHRGQPEAEKSDRKKEARKEAGDEARKHPRRAAQATDQGQ